MNANELADLVLFSNVHGKHLDRQSALELASLVQSGQLVGWVPIADMPEEWRDGRLLFVLYAAKDPGVAAGRQYLEAKGVTHVMSIPAAPREGG